jgi:hypothetical protein
MATTTNEYHVLMKKLVVDSSNNEVVNILYPTSTSDDIIFSDNVTSNKLPTGVSKLSGILNNLGALAFKDHDTLAEAATKDSKNQTIATTYIKGLSNNSNVITYTYGDGTTKTLTLPTTSAATDTTAGIVKLYTGTGTNTDGTIRQKELTDLLNGKAAKTHTHTVSDLTDITATATEINYLSGVTVNVQTQLNAKASSSDLTTHTGNTTIHITADERTKWNAKQDALTADTDYLTPGTASSTYVNKSPDGTNSLIANNKINTAYLPDYMLGQMVYGGTLSGTTATLTNNAKSKLNTTSSTITLTNNTADTTGYTANEGIYYIATASSTFASLDINTGDWVISTGVGWQKIDNTDAVTGVKGNSESSYRTGNVNITPANIGLGNVTNNKQVKGLASGTTADHVVTWGSDGYTVKDSGYTIATSVPANAVFTDTTYTDATTSADGLMSAADKKKLDSIAEGANNYVLPTASTTLGGVKTTSTVSTTSGYTASPIIDGVVYYQNTTYSNATTSKAGLMSAADKTKLDGLDAIVISESNPGYSCLWMDSSVDVS